MADNYLGPEEVDPRDAQAVLDFLNAVETAEGLARYLGFPGEEHIRSRIANRLLDKRAELGQFSSLGQVAEVEQVGLKRFTNIVNSLRGRRFAGPDQVGWNDVIQALARCEDEFLQRRNVVALAAGFRQVAGRETGELCVKVFVIRKLPAADLPEDQSLPSHVPAADGATVPVDVEEMVPPWAWPACMLPFPRGTGGTLVGLRDRRRPAMGGFSVGHYQVTAGTIATVVRDDRRPGVFYLLSNNHVLADVNTAYLGDPILQPGPVDGGSCPVDMIARLCRYVPIRFGAGVANRVDAAIAQIRFCDVERRVYSIGSPRAVRRRNGVHLGEQVQKTGRTTGYTRGRIIGLHGTVNVNYGIGRAARFREQIITTNMGAGGDSGSLIMDMDCNALGLLFAGSSTHTIVNYIEEVQDQLGIIVAENTL